MKKLIAFFFATCVCISLCACAEQPGMNNHEMNENDQTVTVWLLTEQVSFLSNAEYSRFTYAYDNNGNLIEERFYSRGNQLTHYEYTYDENNNLTAKTEYAPGGATTQFTFSYVFDEKGNVIKTIQCQDGFEDSITTYAYDESGNLVEEITSKGETESSKTTYLYDINGNQIEMHYFQGGIEIYYKTEYDRKGHKTEWTRYNADGTERERYIYHYNLAGNQKSREYYHRGIFAYKTKYTLNEEGVPISWTQGDSETGTCDYQVISCSLERAYTLQKRYGTGRVIIQ